MNDLKLAINELHDSCIKELAKVHSLKDLEQIHTIFLSRNGSVSTIMKQLHSMDLEGKKIFGPLLNQLKANLTVLFEEKKNELEKAEYKAKLEQHRYFDVTATKYQELKGSLHIYTHIVQDLENIFTSMGYQIVDGPEVETSYYNFEALNIPADHPARDMHDTFWLAGGKQTLLRTHTSPLQVRYAEKNTPPTALFATGRCYRNESTDASHDFMFTQGECMYISTDVSIANLLATAQEFLQKIFGVQKVTMRVRPGYFPFVEPGVEIDASCPFCTTGCSICKKTGWIELLGAGLIHPNVLKASGIDPHKYSGFAMGFGIERIAMVKYGITDIRLFHSSKEAFLNQFASL